MSAPAPVVPAEIGGLPTRVEVCDVAGRAIELVAVADLESRLDRSRLLNDEAYVPPYWALLWSGARVLAAHVVEQVDCRGRAVLDVGCGLGLTALAAAACGGRVTAIDRDPVALAFLGASAAHNRLPVALVEGDVNTAALGGPFDVVLCAELLYEAGAFVGFAGTFRRVLAPGGRVLLADARRMDTAPFYAAVRAAGFVERERACVEVLEESTRVRVRLVELTARG